jgi:glycosyltransferase involved in cell wall biosynthesis
MAVYNGRPFLRTAMDSILAQSYRDFRFLIVDDASTDDTREIVRSYPDPRIELLPLARNVGQTAALNLGLRHASSPWIARMDADDFSAPTRLEEQMRVLASDASLRCVGSWAWEFRDDPATADTIIARPEAYPQIRRAAFQGAGVIHGSAVLSRESLLEVGAYDERFRYASDREMFIRFLGRHPAANVPKPLLGVRRHPNQDSFSKIAADEYVDIFVGLLRNPGASAEEREIVRRSLAYSYLFRAGYLWAKRSYGAWGRDLLSACTLSPATCARFVARVAASALLPRRVVTTLQRGFMRPAS